MDIEIGGETFHKEPNLLEQIAYRDTWGRGADSFIAMIYERLILMRDLLAEDGAIYVHCDYRVSSHVRAALDEVFGRASIRNHILWLYSGGGVPRTEMPKKHDDIFWYSKGESWRYNPVYREYSEGTVERGRTAVKGEGAELRAEGTPINNWWPDVKKITSPTDSEKLYDPTQKSEELLERIITLSSNEGDLVADFFCGSGTTAAVAEKLGRKWIATDLGKFGIHTTRKRLIGVQRQRKAEEKDSAPSRC
jgi:site-specific DNA-methyltransferase (adenine-specific)/adenine-specific DNA-methyltransferase